MTDPGIALRLLDGAQATAHLTELAALHAEVYRDPPYLRSDDADVFPGRFAVQCRQPGFTLAQARHGGYLVGYAAGMPLRPSTSWWRELTTSLPAEITTERPGRTFALLELAVRASWRRQGIGRALHDLLLRDRPEERATLTVRPAATAALAAFQSWGWRKIARTRDQGPGAPVSDVLVAPLGETPAGRLPSCSWSGFSSLTGRIGGFRGSSAPTGRERTGCTLWPDSRATQSRPSYQIRARHALLR